MESNRGKNNRLVRVVCQALTACRANTLNHRTYEARQRVAIEAAALLYYRLEKEYKQAKLKAAKNMGVRIMPTNLEVALELDRIAEETEGEDRIKRLIQMRRDALEIMKALKPYCPELIGSVWRGTIRRGSDIDISVNHDVPEEIIALLRFAGFKITRFQPTSVIKAGLAKFSYHVYAETSGGWQAEIVVRATEEACLKRRCETFGDEICGLNIKDLEMLLEVNPSARFLPYS